MQIFFSICSFVHIEFSSEKFAESISLKFPQLFCSKSENENKRLIFQNKVAKNVLLDTQVAVLNFTRSHFNQIEQNKDHLKNRFSSKMFPSMPRKQMWQLCPVFFAQSPNLMKTCKIFLSNYFVLKMFQLRGWKLTW